MNYSCKLILILSTYSIKQFVNYRCVYSFMFRTFKANDLKMLRVGMSSFFDMVTVAAKTILEFSE